MRLDAGQVIEARGKEMDYVRKGGYGRKSVSLQLSTLVLRLQDTYCRYLYGYHCDGTITTIVVVNIRCRAALLVGHCIVTSSSVFSLP